VVRRLTRPLEAGQLVGITDSHGLRDIYERLYSSEYAPQVQRPARRTTYNRSRSYFSAITSISKSSVVKTWSRLKFPRRHP